MNPFTSRPITDPVYFKGRRDEIEEIGARLKNFHNISIIGQRRIGKTSLLRNLEYLLKQLEYTLNAYFIFFDLEGHSQTTPKELYSLLIRETIKKTERHYEGDSFNEFKDLIETITNTGKGIIYLFDEFESCIKNRYRDEYLPQLRNICSNNPRLAIVTSTKRGLFEAIPKEHPTSPFFNVFITIPLKLLKEEEAKSIIIDYTADSGISLKDEADIILKLAGNHPYFIHLLGFLFFEAKKKGRIDYKEVEKKFLLDAETQFKYYLNELSKKEKDCLYQIVKFGKCEDEEIISGLRQKALLDEDKEGRIKAFSTTFEEFVKKKPEEEDKMTEEEDKMKKRQDMSQNINITGSSGVTIIQAGKDAYYIENKKQLKPKIDNNYPKKKVFISSTCFDLEDVRAELAVALNEWGYIPLWNESPDFPKKPGFHSHDICLDVVKEECDIYILIIDKRHGGISFSS